MIAPGHAVVRNQWGKTVERLEEHIIDRVSSRALTRRYPRHIGWNAQGGPHGKDATVTACILGTDHGATGWGFCGADEAVTKRFVGRRLSDLFNPATGAAPEARAIDVALHDLAGQILSQHHWRSFDREHADFHRSHGRRSRGRP